MFFQLIFFVWYCQVKLFDCKSLFFIKVLLFLIFRNQQSIILFPSHLFSPTPSIMQTPQKPTKLLQENLSTAPHHQTDTKDQSSQKSNYDQTPIDYEHQDDLRLEEIQTEIEGIGGQLEELAGRMRQIQKIDPKYGKFSEQYLELEFDRCNLRKRLIDLDFTHKEINYPRLYAKKKKEELQYERIRKEREQKQKHSASQTPHVQFGERSEELRKTPQFQQEVISERPSEEGSQSNNNHNEVRRFDNSAVKFNLSGSQNPYNASIHKFEFEKINQVESSQFVRSNQSKYVKDEKPTGRQFSRYAYLNTYQDLKSIERQKITYLEERRRMLEDERLAAELREINVLENEARQLRQISRVYSILQPLPLTRIRTKQYRLYDPSLRIYLY